MWWSRCSAVYSRYTSTCSVFSHVQFHFSAMRSVGVLSKFFKVCYLHLTLSGYVTQVNFGTSLTSKWWMLCVSPLECYHCMLQFSGMQTLCITRVAGNIIFESERLFFVLHLQFQKYLKKSDLAALYLWSDWNVVLVKWNIEKYFPYVITTSGVYFVECKGVCNFCKFKLSLAWN